MDSRLDYIIKDLTRDGFVSFLVKISAGAKNDRIIGRLSDGTLKISLSQAPEKGKANRALISFLANELGIADAKISIARGLTNPLKTINISD
jgi:hypothetical protein